MLALAIDEQRAEHAPAERDVEENARRALTDAMDRYADGDASAVGEVYERLAPRLRAFFLRRTGDCGAADDLVQETFVRVHLARESFVRGADVVPWAFAIARRLLIDRRRLD